MRLVTDENEIMKHKKVLGLAQSKAKDSTCLARKCGAVLVSKGVIIGMGFNSPPRNLESQRRCLIDKNTLHTKVTDTTCCVHAERRAISNALKSLHNIFGSTMYFTSVDEEGERILSGEPYCTDCSKISLDEGVNEWVLEHERGIVVYGAEEYNEISFNYGRA